ncbi:MAG TPA: Wzz/FepE/Etk N-terminal domain-containing protein [Bacteroidales bacterium]|nr:Wzz/FepE/Etk N-terminal domain-containing protein [Bacteroidales bacterium]HRX95628.1 Wzz/FepE/Etk N-terminal domain-containing protein [Bacteroidales bacterium]
MIKNVKGSEDFDSTSFIIFLYKWRKPLVIITLAAMIISIVVSSPLFITPKFKSTVILYPVSTSSISKALLSENASEKQDVMQFGEEEQTEQMLQILNSNRIRDRVIEKYGLEDHYEIDPNSSSPKTKLYKTYESNISFRRTEYMAVQISVLDKDPVVAANIANDIAELLDSTKNAMQKERAIRAYKIVEGEYHQQLDFIQTMEDSLTVLRKLGVHDYESQAEMINQQLAIELAKGNKSGVKALEDKLEVLAQYGGPYVSIRDQLEFEKKQLSEIKAKYEEAKVDAEEVLPQKFVVDNAYPAEKKSYPVRWIIVLVSTISAFILGILILAVLESLGRYSKKKSLTLK